MTVQINPYSAEREERRSPTRNARDEHSARDRRKENYRLIVFLYLFSYVILSFLLCQPGSHAPCRRLSVCLFVFFLARPRGTLIATAIIKETGKLRINLSLEVCFDSPQLSVSPTSKSFALQNTPADHEVFRPHETSESNH